MDCLPTEILIDVFTHCSSFDTFSPSKLARISTRFNAIVKTSPTIWTNLVHHTPYHSDRWAAQTAIYLARSDPLPFDITLEYDQREDILPLIAPLLADCQRWSSLTVNNARIPLLNMPSVDAHSALHITITGYDNPDEYIYIWKANPSIPRSIPSVILDVHHLPAYHIQLPFQTIEVREHWSSGIDQDRQMPEHVLALISDCPHLEHFTFFGRTSSAIEYSPRPSSPTPLTLDRLTHLTISRTFHARSLLSALDTPALTHLVLDSLNIEEAVRTDVLEPGDSDDEAGDFSRSPGSDRMTGVGLANLIRHSPLMHLKHLRMDYTDVRTKDFTYLFSHLTQLESFSIVGSDMSDRVVRLFDPKYGRVKRLKKVQLVGCPEISGDVVVEAFQGRALDKMVVAECAGFTEEHADRMRAVLGDRFGEVHVEL